MTEPFQPRRPRRFPVEKIVLAKGSTDSAERRKFVEAICALYPEAAVVDARNIPHNKIEIAGSSFDGIRHATGKKTLVFGEHMSAVRFSKEEGNTCPNYWHFSPIGFCFFGCKYCYLAGTPGVWHSPSVKIYVNLDEVIRQIDLAAHRLAKPTAFYLGKLQDGLALDLLTGYSERLVPFFAQHHYARQIILTKTDEVDRLLPLNHRGHTILSWSLNPQRVVDEFEENTPSLDERLRAMKKCAERGYLLRAVVMPLVPIQDWKDEYEAFLRRLLREVSINRLTLGGICSYSKSRLLMENKLGKANAISLKFETSDYSQDGRVRYPQALRAAMYSHIVRIAKEMKPELEVALCLEEKPVWTELGIEQQLGKCNCVL